MHISLLVPLALLASLAAATPMLAEKAAEARSAVMGRNLTRIARSDEINSKVYYYQCDQKL